MRTKVKTGPPAPDPEPEPEESIPGEYDQFFAEVVDQEMNNRMLIDALLDVIALRTRGARTRPTSPALFGLR